MTQRRDERKKKSKCGRRRRDGYHLAGRASVFVGWGGETGAHEGTKRLKRGGEVRTYAGSCRSPVFLWFVVMFAVFLRP